MLRASFRIGRLFGIEIGAHVSWLIIVVLVTLSLAARFQASYPGWTAAERHGAALLAALLFFASVVVHELSHSLMARRYGIEVRRITLFLFGGVSQIESDAKRPIEEINIAVVGPMASFALGIVFTALHLLGGAATLASGISAALAQVNFLLGFFNLLPAFPLDGGRVLRGVVWWWTADHRRATNVAAAGGRVLATVMIVGGVLLFFGGQGINGLWFVFLGWFLLDAANAGAREVEVRHALRGVTAADLMSQCPEIEAAMPLDRFVNETLLHTGRRCFVVTDGGTVLGLVTPRDLQAIERASWPGRTVGDAMQPLDRLRYVERTTSAEQVLALMGKEDLNQLPVIENGRLLGIVTREHLIRLLTTSLELRG